MDPLPTCGFKSRGGQGPRSATRRLSAPPNRQATATPTVPSRTLRAANSVDAPSRAGARGSPSHICRACVALIAGDARECEFGLFWSISKTAACFGGSRGGPGHVLDLPCELRIAEAIEGAKAAPPQAMHLQREFRRRTIAPKASAIGTVD